MQVTSIEPVITKEGDVNIRLKVSGDRDRAVQLVRNLEQSQRFLGPRLNGESAQSAEGGRAAGSANLAPNPLAVPGVEFDILSGYNPLPLTPQKQKAAPVVAKSVAAAPAKTKTRTGGHAMSATLQAVAQRAAARNIAERAKRLVTMLNLHFAGVAVLGLVNLYLIVHMVVVYQQAHSQNEEAVAQQMVLLKTAQLGAAPLEGLDTKLTQATGEADAFYARRLPSAYSQLLAELGVLANREHVKLSRVQYAQAPVLADTAGELTEVKMDANLSGDYRPLVIFMNSLERDKMFFVITNIALTGQQSGTVNLRLRLTTYLRARAPGEALAPLVSAEGADVPEHADQALPATGRPSR